MNAKYNFQANMRPMELGITTNSEYPVNIKSECGEIKEEEYDFDVHDDTTTKSKNKSNKSRRKAALPQRASPLRDSSLGEDSQTSQSSMEDNSNSSEEIHKEELDFEVEQEIKDETSGEQLDTPTHLSRKTNNEYKSKSDIKCNMCKKLFQYKSEFDSHYQTAYSRTPVYTCMFCNKTMEKYATFRSHCYRHITEGRFRCEDCGQGFKLQSHLELHIMGKHSKVKPFSCEECGKNFGTKAGLKIHTKRHQGEAKEDYPCAQCGKVLHTRGGLTSHMNVHRLGRRFMCDVCGKTFTQKVNMQQHVKQHTGDKPFECDKCGKAFAEKSHLARHNTFHTEDRPFKCEICGKMYKTERCLKVHRLVHGKERPYVCTYCKKGFLSSTKLKQHYNIHTGERPFACKYCERKFTNYPNWLKHTRRKHNVDHKTGADLPPKPPASNVHEHIEPDPNLIPPPPDSNHYNLAHIPSKQSVKSVKLEVDHDPDLDVELDPDLDADPETYLYDDDYDDYALAPTYDLLPHLEPIDHEPIHHDNLTTDFKLSKNDELYLQQRILNFPTTDSEPKDPSSMLPLGDVHTFDLVPFI